MTNLVGQTLGKYHLVARLGRGGMAQSACVTFRGTPKFVSSSATPPP
jgi:hypothetical protein